MAISMSVSRDEAQQCTVDATLAAVEQFLTRHKMLRDEIRAGNVRVGAMALQAISPAPTEPDA